MQVDEAQPVVWTCRAAKAKSRQKREIVDTLRTLLSDLTPCPPKIGHFLLHGGRRTRADKSCRRLRGSSVVTVGHREYIKTITRKNTTN